MTKLPTRMPGSSLKYAIGAALAAASTASMICTAQAQQTNDTSVELVPIETVTITGSRIRRKDERSSSPVQTLEAEDLRLDGSLSVGKTLQALPSVGASLNSNGSAGVSHGTSSLNLRSLGANRSLVLVNGRRWVNGTGTRGFRDFVDFNTIPQAIIERVEVLQDGATAIYGADAIAGVVNLQTFKDFDGLRVNVQYGVTAENDRDTVGADLLLGENFGASNVMFAASYLDQKPIYTQDRELTAVPLNGLDVGTPEGLFRESGLAARLAACSPPVAFSPTVGITRDSGVDGSVPCNWRAGVAATDRFNRYHDNYVIGPSQISSAYFQSRTALGENTRFTTEALYNRRESDQLFSADVPVIQGSRGFVIPNDPRVNPFGVELSGGDFFVNNVFTALGPRVSTQDVKTVRFGVGLDGALANGWEWNTFASWAENKATFTGSNVLDLDRLALGLRACNTTGITANVADLAQGCVPVNLFQPMTSAMVDYIRYTGRDFNKAEQIDVTANLIGELFNLPAGALAFAAGIEYREEIGLDLPDPYAKGRPRINTFNPTTHPSRVGTDGEYDLREVYVELDVPLLNEKPFFRQLSLQLAARHSDYSTFGSTTNGKVGALWRPVDGLVFRGTWAEGFRAPSILELFEGERRAVTPVTDPCNNGGAGRPGCAGVPSTYAQPTASLLSSTGGNGDLRPETSENVSLGMVLTPGFLPSASLTVDWYRIVIDDTIRPFGAQNILDLCANTGEQCGLVKRDASGSVLLIEDQPINLDSTKTEGVDLVARYRADTPLGAWTFVLSASRLLEFTEEAALANGGIRVTEKLGTAASRESYPKWRGVLTTQWSGGQWSANYKARYIGETTETVSGAPRHIESILYHDVSASRTFGGDVTLRLGVDNVLDEQPPASRTNLNINFDINTYDPVGRFFYGRLVWNFGD